MTMKDGSFKSSLFICFFFPPFRTPYVNKEIAGLKSPRIRVCFLRPAFSHSSIELVHDIILSFNDIAKMLVFLLCFAQVVVVFAAGQESEAKSNKLLIERDQTVRYFQQR